MDERLRDHFARHVLSAQQLSECEDPRAAVVVRGERVIGTGISKSLIPNQAHQSSAIAKAVLEHQSQGGRKVKYYEDWASFSYQDDHPPRLFSTYFPSYDEFLLLFLTPIREVYYFGDVTDEKAVKLLNAHTKFFGEHQSASFQIIKLNFEVKNAG